MSILCIALHVSEMLKSLLAVLNIFIAKDFKQGRSKREKYLVVSFFSRRFGFVLFVE